MINMKFFIMENLLEEKLILSRTTLKVPKFTVL